MGELFVKYTENYCGVCLIERRSALLTSIEFGKIRPTNCDRYLYDPIRCCNYATTSKSPLTKLWLPEVRFNRSYVR